MKRRIQIWIALIALGLTGCNNKSQIPAFIRIDGVTVDDTLMRGFKSSNNISDDWVTVSGNYIGTFQNPTRFPVLEWGKVQCIFTPGVKADGISTTREIYPFLKPCTMTVDLVAGQVANVKPVYHYYSNISVPVNEYFEDSINTFAATTDSGYAGYSITHDTSKVFSGKGSLYVHLTPTKSVFQIQTKNAVYLPFPANATWMELNFKVDMPTTVGVTSVDINGAFSPVYLIDLQPTTEWKKMYIDFTSTVQAASQGSFFLFNIEGTLPSGQQQGNIYIDNVRVLTYLY